MSKKSYILLSIALLIYAMYFTWLGAQFPFIIDDFYYRYIHIHHYGDKISSIGDIITSQIWHYQHINGRSLIHFLLQLTLLITNDKIIISAINSIVWLLLAHMIVKNTIPQQHRKWVYWLISIVALRFALPASYNIPFWVAGCFNYYYTSLLALVVTYLYQNIKPKTSYLYYPLYILLAFVAGWSHESLAIGLSAAFILDLFLRPNKNSLHVLMCTACCIGCIITIMAPGNFCRFDVKNISGATSITGAISVILQARLFYITLLLIIWGLCKKAKETKHIIFESRIFLTMMIVNLAFCAFVGAGERALFFSELSALLFIIKYIDTLYHPRLTNRLGGAILAIFIIYESFFAIEWNRLYNEINRTIKEFETSQQDYIISKDITTHPLTRWHIEDSNARWKFYEFKSLSYLYQKEFRVLPLSVYNAIKSDKLFLPAHRIEGDLPFYTNEEIDWIVMPCNDVPASGIYSYNLHKASIQDPNLTPIGKLRRIFIPNSLPTSFGPAVNFSSDASKPYLIDNKYYIILRKPQYHRIKSVVFTPVH